MSFIGSLDLCRGWETEFGAIPGQLFGKQEVVSKSDPSHGAPPKYGPKHVRFLNMLPLPHVKLQADHSFHSL